MHVMAERWLVYCVMKAMSIPSFAAAGCERAMGGYVSASVEIKTESDREKVASVKSKCWNERPREDLAHLACHAAFTQGAVGGSGGGGMYLAG